ncbi:MAG: 50S ribosomal protein L6 [Phycisphaeraceae bacterium]|nr:50S ribosomal protein L6 [Phycisphaeraceae bacterium]
MSRIGKKPVTIEGGASVSVSGRTVTVEKGSAKLTYEHRPEVSVKVNAGQVIVERKDESRAARAYHGMTRALIANMVKGVTQGFVKDLEIVGVGWNAQLQGKTVKLNVGYADAKVVDVPPGVKVEINGPKIKVSGPDKQKVGLCAAEIRAQRPPEPYNGKGIKYADEHIVRKQGKAFAGTAS